MMATRGMERFRGALKAMFIVLIMLGVRESHAQNVQVRSGFLSDSIKIGEETGFYLSARYASELTVLFPDSTYRFAPFEYLRKTYFPTKTNDSISVDSAVFYFTTFEIDRRQQLSLPVFVVQPRDCTIYTSIADTLLITQLVAKVPDSVSVAALPLKMDTAYRTVFFQFNFWILLIAVAVLLILAVVVWVLYGKKIKQYFKARSLRRQHQRFVNAYASILQQLQQQFTTPETEQALATWKRYMEQLEAKPFSKLTTKETAFLLQDDQLRDNLRSIDQSIYGNRMPVLPSLHYLRGYADQRFSQKLEEVKNGK